MKCVTTLHQNTNSHGDASHLLTVHKKFFRHLDIWTSGAEGRDYYYCGKTFQQALIND